MRMAESEVDETVLAWLETVGWTIKNEREVAPGELFSPQQNCDEAQEGT